MGEVWQSRLGGGSCGCSVVSGEEVCDRGVWGLLRVGGEIRAEGTW